MVESKKRKGYLLWQGSMIFVLAALLAILPFGGPRAFAAGDAWLASAELLGVAGTYSACLHEILSLGNDAYCQIQTLQEDMKTHGVDENTLDKQLTDQVMRQLAEHGAYVLDARSLPFRWAVNNKDDFNACCYPTNYISVNRGLVRGLGCNPDELAAVLGHEMTHGLRQHSAHNYAKAVATYYGMGFLNMTTNAMDGNVMAALADYSIAKNVTLPTEYEADEGGFYLLASAGFNPGGSAAAMAHMQYYETNLSSYFEVYDPYDHPDTNNREIRLMQLLTDYSCGHVTVKNRREIDIDGKPLLTAHWTTEEYDNTAENAYFIAGGLAKAFHDYTQLADWCFQTGATGHITYLTDSRVYNMLKDFVAANHAEDLLQQLVTEAYTAESATGARIVQQKAEKGRRDELDKLQEKNKQTSRANVKMMRMNGDAYIDLGLPELGIFEVNRAFACEHQDNMAENYSIRGRGKAMLGKYTEAIADCNKALEMDAKNPYNYLNRADAYRAKGDRQAALQDCQQAIQLRDKLPDAYKLMADLYDEMGEKAHALENYRLYKKLFPKAPDIPAEYLVQLDPPKTVDKK